MSALHQGHPCHQAQAEQQLPAQGAEALAWKTQHLCKNKEILGLQLPRKKKQRDTEITPRAIPAGFPLTGHLWSSSTGVTQGHHWLGERLHIHP